MDYKPLWPGHRYYDHQLYAIKWMIEHPGGILADDIGLGKMIETIGFIVNAPVERTLILAPLAMLDNWIQTLLKVGVRVFIASRTCTWIPLTPDSYGTIDVHITNIDKIFKPFIQAEPWDRFIIDEAHAIRNPKSQLNSAANSVHSTIKWAITNSPIIDSYADLATLLQFVIGHPITSIRQLIGTHILCRTMDQLRLFDTDAPPRPEIYDVICPYSSATEEASYKTLIESVKADPITLYKKISALRTCPMAKLKAIKTITELDKMPNKHHVILCSHHDEMQLIAMYCRTQCSVDHVIIDNAEERDLQLEFARSTKSCIYIMQIKTAYMGINLVDFNSLIIMSPWWSTKVINNIIGCIVRIGQQDVVNIYHINYSDDHKIKQLFYKSSKSNEFMEFVRQYADHRISI